MDDSCLADLIQARSRDDFVRKEEWKLLDSIFTAGNSKRSSTFWPAQKVSYLALIELHTSIMKVDLHQNVW